jgi:short subunit fatty acids transporter
MKITPQFWTLVKAFGLAISGIVAKHLVSDFHMVPDDVQDYFTLIEAGTAFAGAAWGLSTATPAAQVTNAALLPPEQARVALAQVSDATKVLVAKAVPGVATVVLHNDVTNGLAVLAEDDRQPDIVTAAQNEKDARAGPAPRLDQGRT